MTQDVLSREQSSPFQEWEADHARHGETLATLDRRLTESGMDAAILQDLRGFQIQLKQHYTAEEYVIFPVLNQYRPMVLMTVEHDELLRHLDRVIELGQEALQGISTPLKLWEPVWQSFRTLLEGHIHEEDQQLTPWMMSVLRPDQIQGLKAHWAAFMETYSPEHFPLLRPKPQVFKGASIEPQASPNRPIQYFPWATLGEGTQVQRMVLAKGASTATHWSPQHQWMYVLSGTLCAQSPISQGEDGEIHVSAGESLHLTPRCEVKLRAQDSDVDCLVVKSWPTTPPFAPSPHSTV